MKKFKLNKKLLITTITSTLALASITAIAAACSKKETTTPTPTTNNDRAGTTQRVFDRSEFPNKNLGIDFSQHGVANFSGDVNTRQLLFPAQTRDNKLNADGIFEIKLHLNPTRGAKGKWYAFATEVKSANDNTLVNPSVVYRAETTAKEGVNLDNDFPLVWKFDQEGNKLQEGKFYTFVFYAADGSDRIIFSLDNIRANKDIFPATK